MLDSTTGKQAPGQTPANAKTDPVGNFTCFLAWLTKPNTLSRCGLLISAPMRVPSSKGSPTGMALVLFTTSSRNWGMISLWTYTLVPLQQTWAVERLPGDTCNEPARDRAAAAAGKASPVPGSGSWPWARPSLRFPARSLWRWGGGISPPAPWSPASPLLQTFPSPQPNTEGSFLPVELREQLEQTGTPEPSVPFYPSVRSRWKRLWPPPGDGRAACRSLPPLEPRRRGRQGPPPPCRSQPEQGRSQALGERAWTPWRCLDTSTAFHANWKKKGLEVASAHSPQARAGADFEAAIWKG